MKVTLLSYTPDALELLLFTKATRLRMSAGLMDDIRNMPMVEKLKQLEYMRNTIQSSWEFVEYVFLIEDVTRAFTHQLVRHRVGVSFAQQAQRAVDMSGFTYVTPPSVAEHASAIHNYRSTMNAINEGYQRLLGNGIPAQDARGVLPTNVCTNIVMKANLRTLHEMGLKRLCVKSQGEFQQVFREIRERVVEVHPWAERFIRVWCAFHGTCCFPTFPVKDCHVKAQVYNPETGLAYGAGVPGSLDGIQAVWANGFSEAQPKGER
jgi:flavin-dependent thymidylate synthase